jgi:2-keto-4-pentenoate hydratase/2-oxohepta-3-ene-1,7-dioic acid hydratase in catechol pathway/catechol 2,3-dioxygenase-like lactoylglutathione lyase family enzyme
MRLVSFSIDGSGTVRSGIETEDGIADVQSVGAVAGFSETVLPLLTSTRAVLALAPDELRTLESTAASSASELRDRGALHSRDAVRLRPPIPDPQKIVCLGLNYRDHAKEAGLQPPSAPMFFAKFANSLVGPADAIVPPATTDEVDYEAELAVVIGRRASRVGVDDALDYIAGVMAFNDVSARDLQLANNLWTGGKAIDTFGPCGPALVTLDEIGDIQALPVRTRVNGRTVQDGNTAEMIFSVAEIIAFLSQIMTLESGDIIATGTPAGVGNSRIPKLFLRAGDVVEVEIDGVGTLRNPVAGAAGVKHLEFEERAMSTTVVNPVLHHVNLKTTRLQEMIDWYALVIGTQVTHQFEGGAWLTNDAANHRLALLSAPGLEDDPEKLRHAGLHHSAYEYRSMDDLLDMYVRLKGDGIVPHACLDHGMTMSFYYVDPDGNSVELQCDEFGDWAKSKKFMRTAPEFAADPIGVNIDPDAVVAARDAGASAEELHRRAYSGEFTPEKPLNLRLPEPLSETA